MKVSPSNFDFHHGGWIKKALLILLALIACGIIFVIWFLKTLDQRETSHVAFQDYCAACHHPQLTGTDNGPSLRTEQLKYGASPSELEKSIRKLAIHQSGAWQGKISETMVTALALYVDERRQQWSSSTVSYEDTSGSIKGKVFDSEHHPFTVEVFTRLAGRPYSIEPLPDGRILVNEKTRGLSIVDQQGNQSPIVKGSPKAWEQLATVLNSYLGWGWMLDIELHPDYQSNGWIYLAYGDRCQLSCGSLMPQSMVKVVRGRIKGKQWVDEQTIWSAPQEYYTIVPDGVAAGRLAFDGENRLYITIGGKAPYKHLHNLDTPYGKIHRVNDDGSIPDDNPFKAHNKADSEPSTKNTLYSYGHRTTQGLTTHPQTKAIWSSEMGPRGGDEINLIESGGNYGWPLYTNGLAYNGTESTIGKDLGLDFPIESTVLPIVDFTPAPAISNIQFYSGEQFDKWNNDLLVGSLKAQTLYRLKLVNNELIEQEKLINNIGRIRDVEVGSGGEIYVAVENVDGGMIFRLSQ